MLMPTRKSRCFQASLIALLLPAAWAQAPAESPPAAETIRARVVANFTADQEALVGFVHTEHVVTARNGERDGRTLRVWYVRGHEVSETIAVDGRSLSRAEVAAEQKRAADRAAAMEKRQPARAGVFEYQSQTYPFTDLSNDYIYGPPNVRVEQGRTLWVYEASPNPGAARRSTAEQLLLHSEAEIWVDAEDLHLVHITIHTTAPVRYGLGVIATIHSAGMTLDLERYAAGVWLPRSAGFSLQATLLLLKSLDRSKQQEFSDYRQHP
jgi:hypothetical protein